MKIRMLSTQNGSLDGIKVGEYAAGIEYDLTKTPGARDLAQAFVGARMAVEVLANTDYAISAGYPETFDADGYKALFDKADAPEPEAKAIEAAPENKMLDGAPTSKRKGKK